MPPGRLTRAGYAWLAAIGTSLLLAFAAIAWVQSRQVVLLNSAVRYEGDNLLWGFFQLESEFLRLRDQLRDAVRRPDESSAEALRLQFEIFASRLPLVSPDRVQSVFPLEARDQAVVDALTRFIAEADPWLAEAVTTPLSQAPLTALVEQLDAQAPAVHDLILKVNQLSAENVARRNTASGQLTRQGISLTIFQSLLTLAFVAIAWRQVRALARRRQELEELATNLDEARLQAEAASRAKSAFLANMSHELRTPFNGLLGMLTLLEVSPLDADQTDHLRTARQSATHLLHLLNDILDVSKLVSGRLDLQTAPTSLHRLLGDVGALMMLPSEAKGLRLKTELADDLPVWVMADEMRVKQILFNLLANAIKFTDQGDVVLRAEPCAEGLRLQVRDSGIGMDAAAQARLFQRFTQGEVGTGKRYGGTGLGLEISRNLARMMDGDITVQSQPLQGSTFTVTLPLPPCPPPPGVEALALAEQAVGRTLDVLVVDDQAINRKLMQRLLTRMGHRVRLAADGSQAVEAVRQQVPDLILMDLHMPVLDGLQATTAIRELPAPANAVPIVALTADAFRETRDRLLAGGMDGFLAKPLELPALQDLLQAHGGHSEMAAPAASEPAAQRTAARPRSKRRFRAGEVAQALDMAVIGELWVGISIDSYRTLLQGFFADESGSMQILRSALQSGESGLLKEHAHAVKGAAGSLGLRALHVLAREIEQEGAGFDAAACTLRADALDQTLEHTRALCERMGVC
jgi:signal transduction histidine kinase/DNA-binding NarL/FixJ family response regulator/HPt (histidine-containing phosphotransfer) domain-containing protein